MGIVEVRDLWYRYPGISEPALKGLNLEIEEGEFILLTGPSGCGKTTFCRCLNGLIPHFYNGDLRGEVTINGLSIRENPINRLATNVGLIFQNPDNQIFALTVEKDVAFGLENLGVEKNEMLKHIDWALDRTGLQEMRQRATYELSGGQKQRLAVASILAMKPKIIVLDEPTSFLDPMGAEKIFNVLLALNKEDKITIILIEHRIDLAARYVNRVILFNDGRIIDDGPPEKVFSAEESRLAGVGIPKIIQLGKRLRRMGVNLEDLPLDALTFTEKLKEKLVNKKISLLVETNTKVNRIMEDSGNRPIIKVCDISYSYPNGVEAIKNISLNISKGEFIAIMGENGAGKTTLVKHFNGLLRPQTGKIFIDGIDSATMSVAALARKVGLVFQNPDDQLFSENVEEEIQFALKNFGFSREIIEKRVNWALNLLDIERYRKSSPFVLSGGERKRVALASVLAWDPDVLVLDEPTIGQDYAQKERLRHFLLQLRSQGKTTVIVTHDVEFVVDSKPRILLMSQGHIIADGPTELVMTDFEMLEKASVSPPEILKVFRSISDLGFPKNVFDVDEAAEIISRSLRGGLI
ncbi:ATP-binding cassette domain-containing protein [Candidatus Bathyarchaeota archaeon]|nr:ATP-binding cassette domain-containing protein [Candidatus Bathyarchaeota archaeon]